MSCTDLVRINLPSSINYIGSYAFINCSSLDTIVLPENLDSVEKGTFWSCQALNSVTLPDGLSVIENSAFQGCANLSTIILPKSLEFIGLDAFSGTTLSLFFKDNLGYLFSPTSAFLVEAATASGDITLPREVNGRILRSIDAFKGLDSLTSVVVPDSITRIADSNFSECSRLEDITLPSSILSIGDSAFRSCHALTKITLPFSLMSIGDSAFSSCPSLTKITLPSSLISIGDFAFYGSSNLLMYTLLTDGSISVGRDAFRLSRSLKPGGTVFVLPEHLTSFGGIGADWHGLTVDLSNHPASPYSQAVHDAGLVGLDSLPDATPFNDGVPNILKLAFNMNLSGPDNRMLTSDGRSGLPSFDISQTGSGSVWRVEYLRCRAFGLHYSPMKSVTLEENDFHIMTGTQIVTEVFLDESTGIEWERVVIEEPTDLTTTPKLFSRINVSFP